MNISCTQGGVCWRFELFLRDVKLGAHQDEVRPKSPGCRGDDALQASGRHLISRCNCMHAVCDLSSQLAANRLILHNGTEVGVDQYTAVHSILKRDNHSLGRGTLMVLPLPSPLPVSPTCDIKHAE